MTLEENEDFTRRLGISKEQHDEWHRKPSGTRPPSTKEKGKLVNPYAIGGGFLSYCTKQGWIIQEGAGRDSKYYVTAKGQEKLARFGIRT